MYDWREACLRSQTRECYGYDKDGNLIVIHFVLFGPPVVEVLGERVLGHGKKELVGLPEALQMCLGWSPVLIAGLEHYIN